MSEISNKIKQICHKKTKEKKKREKEKEKKMEK
jgi:hypothetical protein